MTGDVFRFIVSGLASYAARTNIEATCCGLVVKGQGLNSPYVSHRRYEFGPCEHTPRLYLVFGPDAGLAVCQSGDSEPTADEVAGWADAHQEAVVVRAPWTLIEPAVCRLREIVPDLFKGWQAVPTHLVWVIVVRPRLLGWREDGSPILAEATAPATTAPADEPTPASALVER